MARFYYFLKTMPFFPNLTYHLSNSLQPLSLFFSFTLDLSHYHRHLDLFVTSDLTLVSPCRSHPSLAAPISHQSHYAVLTLVSLQISHRSHASLTVVSRWSHRRISLTLTVSPPPPSQSLLQSHSHSHGLTDAIICYLSPPISFWYFQI